MARMAIAPQPINHTLRRQMRQKITRQLHRLIHL